MRIKREDKKIRQRHRIKFHHLAKKNKILNAKTYLQNRGSVIPCLHSTDIWVYDPSMREWDRSHVVTEFKWFLFVDVIFFSSMTEFNTIPLRVANNFIIHSSSLSLSHPLYLSLCVFAIFFTTAIMCVSFYDVLIINRWVQFVRSHHKNQHQRQPQVEKTPQSSADGAR